MKCHTTTTVRMAKCSDAIHVGHIGELGMVLCMKTQTNDCAHLL